jgi:hypothetical protein
MAKDFSSLEGSRLVLVATQPPMQWVMEKFFLGGKGEEHLGCEAGHSPVSDARNEWNMFVACTETNLLYQIYYRYLSQITTQITKRQVTSILRNTGVYSKDEFHFNVYQSNVISVRI